VNDFVLARVLHVIGVVLWIGGVAMVTTVLLPAAKRLATPAERIAFFERVEHRFAAQVRITTLVTGLSGFYLAWRFDLWGRFADARFWWMHAMVAVWLLFTLVLFVLEPLVLHRWFSARAARNPEGTFALVQRFHWLLLALSVVTIAGAVAGSHGGWW
jgi:uncharacterized membrane protein